MFKQTSFFIKSNFRKIKLNKHSILKSQLQNFSNKSNVIQDKTTKLSDFNTFVKFINDNPETKIQQILDLYSKAITAGLDKSTIDDLINLKEYILFLKSEDDNQIIKDLFYSTIELINRSITSLIRRNQFFEYLEDILNRLQIAISIKDYKEADKLLIYLELDVDCFNTNDPMLLDYNKLADLNNMLVSILKDKEIINKSRLKKIITFYSHLLKSFGEVREYIKELIDYDDEYYKNYEEMRLIKRSYNLVLQSQSHLEVEPSVTLNSLNEVISIREKLKTLNAFDKLKNILDVDITEIYRGIYYAYIAESDHDMALMIFHKLEDLYKEHNDFYNLSLSYYFSAAMFIGRSDHENCIKYASKFYEFLDKIDDIANEIRDEKNFEKKLMIYKELLDYEQRVAVLETMLYFYECRGAIEELEVLPYFEEYNDSEMGILMFQGFELFFQEFNQNLLFVYFKILNVNYQAGNKKICIEMGEEILSYLGKEYESYDQNTLNHLYIETYFALIVCYSDIEVDKSNNYIEILYENYTSEDIGEDKENLINSIIAKNENKLISK